MHSKVSQNKTELIKCDDGYGCNKVVAKQHTDVNRGYNTFERGSTNQTIHFINLIK